jgi:hypothetical protein
MLASSPSLNGRPGCTSVTSVGVFAEILIERRGFRSSFLAPTEMPEKRENGNADGRESEPGMN